MEVEVEGVPDAYPDTDIDAGAETDTDACFVIFNHRFTCCPGDTTVLQDITIISDALSTCGTGMQTHLGAYLAPRPS